MSVYSLINCCSKIGLSLGATAKAVATFHTFAGSWGPHLGNFRKPICKRKVSEEREMLLSCKLNLLDFPRTRKKAAVVVDIKEHGNKNSDVNNAALEGKRHEVAVSR